jgi:hypothetical protein
MARRSEELQRLIDNVTDRRNRLAEQRQKDPSAPVSSSGSCTKCHMQLVRGHRKKCEGQCQMDKHMDDDGNFDPSLCPYEDEKMIERKSNWDVGHVHLHIPLQVTRS